MEQNNVILEARSLSIRFRQYKKGLRQTRLPALRDLSVTVRQGEVVAVVGSSGSGKSLLAHAVLGVLPSNAVTGGELFYRGEPLTRVLQKQLRGREIVLVPQSVSYLDPLMKVGPQIRGVHGGTGEQVNRLLDRYGLERKTAGLYPFELSGGMARRVLIATALMNRPKLVIADEPTPGLHASVAKRVMGHFRELADEGAGVLLITHDLELALLAADRIAVFYAGTTVEEANAADFESEDSLRHPYTKALWRAMPQNGFQSTPGAQPYAGDLPEGCPYRPRCPLREERCGGEIPYRPLAGGFVRCIHGEEGAYA